MKFGSSVVVLALIILAAHEQLKSQAHNGYNGFDLVDKTGNIRKPADYRDNYQALGTYTLLNPTNETLVPSTQKGGSEMHYTYASPGTAEYYRKTGKFADGAVLVKELFGTDHAPMTTGDVLWASRTKIWFVMIKDEKGRFPGNPLWSD